MNRLLIIALSIFWGVFARAEPLLDNSQKELLEKRLVELHYPDEKVRLVALDYLLEHFLWAQEKLKATDIEKMIDWSLLPQQEGLAHAAHIFLKTHFKKLLDYQLISATTFNAWAKEVYANPLAFKKFLRLYEIIIETRSLENGFQNPENIFNTIDGLKSKEKFIVDQSVGILKKYGPYLTQNKYFEKSHMARFVLIAQDLTLEVQSDYIDILVANLKDWAEFNLLSSTDMRKLLEFAALLPLDLSNRFYTFLALPETMDALAGLEVFQNGFVEELLEDIYSPHQSPKKREAALYTISILSTAILNQKNMSQQKIQTLHNYILNQLSDFEDPFVFYRLNLKTLVQNNWFDSQHYQQIVNQLHMQDVYGQRKILDFLDFSFSLAENKGWLKIKSWQDLVFEQVQPLLLLARLEFVLRHPVLVTQYGLLDAANCAAFFELLNHSQARVATTTAEILHKTMQPLVLKKLLTTNSLYIILGNQNINHALLKNRLALLDNYYEFLHPFMTKEFIHDLAKKLETAEPKNLKAIKLFFKNHILHLVAQNKISPQIKLRLQSLGVAVPRLRDAPSKRTRHEK